MSIPRRCSRRLNSEFVADTGRFAGLTGWTRPNYTLERGIDQTIERLSRKHSSLAERASWGQTSCAGVFSSRKSK